MAGVEGFTEFDGGGVMPNTVYPKDFEALTASDKLRLMSLTGQTEDSRAPIDPAFWQGNSYFDSDESYNPDPQRARREREIARDHRNLYKESPKPKGY